MTLSIYIMTFGYTITVVILPFFLFPVKIKKGFFPVIFCVVWGLYSIIEYLTILNMEGRINYSSYFMLAIFIEVIIIFGTIFWCTKGNFWKYCFWEMLYGHVTNIFSSFFLTLFPKSSKIVQAYEAVILGQSQDWIGSLEYILLLSLTDICIAIIMHFLIPMEGGSSKRSYQSYKYILITYFVITVLAAVIKQFVHYDFIQGLSQGKELNMVLISIITGGSVIGACNLVGYLYNHIEAKRIRRGLSALRIDELKDDPTMICSGNYILDRQLQVLYQRFQDSDVAFELTMNRPFQEGMVLTEYEAAILLKSISEVAFQRKSMYDAWSVMCIHWNSDMMMLYLEFNRDHKIQRLQRQREFEDIYDIMNQHEGIIKTRRGVNSYEIEMMLFENKTHESLIKNS